MVFSIFSNLLECMVSFLGSFLPNSKTLSLGEGLDCRTSIYSCGNMLTCVVLLLLLALFFFVALHAEGTIVLDFVLCQASLAGFALFFCEHQVQDYISSQ